VGCLKSYEHFLKSGISAENAALHSAMQREYNLSGRQSMDLNGNFARLRGHQADAVKSQKLLNLSLSNLQACDQNQIELAELSSFGKAAGTCTSGPFTVNVISGQIQPDKTSIASRATVSSYYCLD